MSEIRLSRRHMLGMASAAMVSATVPRLAHAQSSAQSTQPCTPGGDPAVAEAEILLASLESAFTFQNLMMDAYATGTNRPPDVRAIAMRPCKPQPSPMTMQSSIHAYLTAYITGGGADFLARAEVPRSRPALCPGT